MKKFRDRWRFLRLLTEIPIFPVGLIDLDWDNIELSVVVYGSG